MPAFQAVAKHQPVERDIAVLVDEALTHAELMAAIWAADAGGLLRDALLFDVYRPKPGAALDVDAGAVREQKSMAVRLTLNSDEATLTESQIELAVQAVLASLQQRLGARQR